MRECDNDKEERGSKDIRTSYESGPFAGLTSSPDMFAPDMMPVTPEKRTPKTVKKLMGTASSNWEQSKANLM